MQSTLYLVWQASSDRLAVVPHAVRLGQGHAWMPSQAAPTCPTPPTPEPAPAEGSRSHSLVANFLFLKIRSAIVFASYIFPSLKYFFIILSLSFTSHTQYSLLKFICSSKSNFTCLRILEYGPLNRSVVCCSCCCYYRPAYYYCYYAADYSIRLSKSDLPIL
jgi:hypothetical protein